MKKICVITGATGLIGTALIDALLPDYELHGIARTPAARADINWHALDLATDCKFDTLPRQIDSVVYLAQSEYFRDFPNHGADVFQVNTVNPLRLLDYARNAGARSFVYASSGGVYGNSPSKVSEDIEIPAHGDIGCYLSSKLCAEIIGQNYTKFLDFISLRFFFVYGSSQSQNMLIPRLIKKVREGKPLFLQGKDGISINPTHVSDAAEATSRALELTGSHTINVGGPDVLSMREIGTIIGKFVGREPKFEIDLGAPPAHLVGDISKMGLLLVPPRMHFVDGLRSML